MAAQRKYPVELRERATRMVLEARRDPVTAKGAVARIGGQPDRRGLGEQGNQLNQSPQNPGLDTPTPAASHPQTHAEVQSGSGSRPREKMQRVDTPQHSSHG